jgi:hypothetical protein
MASSGLTTTTNVRLEEEIVLLPMYSQDVNSVKQTLETGSATVSAAKMDSSFSPIPEPVLTIVHQVPSYLSITDVETLNSLLYSRLHST